MNFNFEDIGLPKIHPDFKFRVTKSGNGQILIEISKFQKYIHLFEGEFKEILLQYAEIKNSEKLLASFPSKDSTSAFNYYSNNKEEREQAAEVFKEAVKKEGKKIRDKGFDQPAAQAYAQLPDGTIDIEGSIKLAREQFNVSGICSAHRIPKIDCKTCNRDLK